MRSESLQNRRSNEAGIALIELAIAMGILSAVMLPMAFSIVQEQRFARAYYCRAVAMEIVDGEMEALAAGEWRAFTKGQHPYRVRANAASNLPPGRFVLVLDDHHMRLEWHPTQQGTGGPVIREVNLPKPAP